MLEPKLTRMVVCALVVVGITVGASTTALATSIGSGFDLFATIPRTFVALGLPPDFFGPGSDPFFGEVDLKGDPIGPGNTDTIVERKQGINPFGDGDTGIIDIEIVELSLTSIDPIPVTGGAGAGDWDVHVGLSPTPSTGTMTIHHDATTEGGTFDSQLEVFPLLTFTRGSDTQVLDTGALAFPPPGIPILLSSSNSIFSSSAIFFIPIHLP